MAGWRRHSGRAVALDLENVDTDRLIPARFMSTPRSEGYGRFLLHDMRFDAGGAPVPGFALNRFPEASILVTRRNFGSGSSREAAVYALADFGFRVVVAPSFGDIFASNAVNNGVLPARVDSTDALIERLSDRTAAAEVDLESQTLRLGGIAMAFELPQTWRDKLINGWDDIDLTQAHKAQIAAFKAARQRNAPWAFSQTGTHT